MQSSDDGEQPQPCEESWRLISKLRKSLPPEKLRFIVNRCGLPSCGSLNKSRSSPLFSGDTFPHTLPRAASGKRDAWLTMADVKVEAVKAVCYEIALSGFQQTHKEIESACVFKLQELCQLYGKRDPNPSETWRAVARDVMDTIGFHGDNSFGRFGNDKELECLKTIKRRNAVQEILSDLVSAVERNDDFILENNDCKIDSSSSEIDKLKESMSALVNMFRGVKLDNASKEEEMKLMKMKIVEMEKALTDNVECGKSLLTQGFASGVATKTSQENLIPLIPQTKPSLVPTDSSSSKTNASEVEKESQKSSDTGFSPRYIHSNDFSEPSHGIIVPEYIKTKEEKIDWLMENDVAFRRGRLRWEAQQKRHQANLRSQEFNKEKRRQERERNKQTNPTQPRFSFKNSKTNQEETDKPRARKPPRKYFEGPRRKTCSAIKDTDAPKLESRVKTVDAVTEETSTVLEKKSDKIVNLNPNKPLFIPSSCRIDSLEAPPRTSAVTIKTRDGKEVKFSHEPYVSHRRKTWCNPSPSVTSPQEPTFYHSPPTVPVPQVIYPRMYKNRPFTTAAYQGPDWIEYTPSEHNWNQVSSPIVLDAPYSSFTQPNIAYLGQPGPKLGDVLYNPNRMGFEAQFSQANSLHSHYVINQQMPRRTTPPLLVMEKPQLVVGNSLLHDSPNPYTTRLYHNPLNELHPSTPSPQQPQASESPPYMSTSMSDSEPTKPVSTHPVLKPNPTVDAEPECTDAKRKVVLKGIYVPPFRRKNLSRQTEL